MRTEPGRASAEWEGGRASDGREGRGSGSDVNDDGMKVE
jgi:hypothetical protein